MVVNSKPKNKLLYEYISISEIKLQKMFSFFFLIGVLILKEKLDLI